jgi:hypothetical protein
VDDQILNTIRTALDTALQPIIDNLADTVERLDKIETGLKCIEDKIDSFKGDIEFTYLKTSKIELEVHRLKEIRAKVKLIEPITHKVEKSGNSQFQSYMVEKEFISIIDDIVEDTPGGKHLFINGAIKFFIIDVFPEFADRIPIKE